MLDINHLSLPIAWIFVSAAATDRQASAKNRRGALGCQTLSIIFAGTKGMNGKSGKLIFSERNRLGSSFLRQKFN